MLFASLKGYYLGAAYAKSTKNGKTSQCIGQNFLFQDEEQSSTCAHLFTIQIGPKSGRFIGGGPPLGGSSWKLVVIGVVII